MSKRLQHQDNRSSSPISSAGHKSASESSENSVSFHTDSSQSRRRPSSRSIGKNINYGKPKKQSQGRPPKRESRQNSSTDQAIGETDLDRKRYKNRMYAQKSRQKKSAEKEELKERCKEQEIIIEIYKKGIGILVAKLTGLSPTWAFRRMEWYPSQAPRLNPSITVECYLPNCDESFFVELGNNAYGQLSQPKLEGFTSKDTKPPRSLKTAEIKALKNEGLELSLFQASNTTCSSLSGVQQPVSSSHNFSTPITNSTSTAEPSQRVIDSASTSLPQPVQLLSNVNVNCVGKPGDHSNQQQIRSVAEPSCTQPHDEPLLITSVHTPKSLPQVINTLMHGSNTVQQQYATVPIGPTVTDLHQQMSQHSETERVCAQQPLSSQSSRLYLQQHTQTSLLDQPMSIHSGQPIMKQGIPNFNDTADSQQPTSVYKNPFRHQHHLSVSPKITKEENTNTHPNQQSGQVIPSMPLSTTQLSTLTSQHETNSNMFISDDQINALSTCSQNSDRKPLSKHRYSPYQIPPDIQKLISEARQNQRSENSGLVLYITSSNNGLQKSPDKKNTLSDTKSESSQFVIHVPDEEVKSNSTIIECEPQVVKTEFVLENNTSGEISQLQSKSGKLVYNGSQFPISLNHSGGTVISHVGESELLHGLLTSDINKTTNHAYNSKELKVVAPEQSVSKLPQPMLAAATQYQSLVGGTIQPNSQPQPYNIPADTILNCNLQIPLPSNGNQSHLIVENRPTFCSAPEEDIVGAPSASVSNSHVNDTCEIVSATDTHQAQSSYKYKVHPETNKMAPQTLHYIEVAGERTSLSTNVQQTSTTPHSQLVETAATIIAGEAGQNKPTDAREPPAKVPPLNLVLPQTISQSQPVSITSPSLKSLCGLSTFSFLNPPAPSSPTTPFSTNSTFVLSTGMPHLSVAENRPPSSLADIDFLSINMPKSGLCSLSSLDIDGEHVEFENLLNATIQNGS